MRDRRKAAWGAAAVAVAIGIGAGVAWWVSKAPPRIDPEDPRQVAAGAALYREHCASCHGAELEGQPDWRTRLPSGRLPAPPHDASGHTWHHPDDVLFEIVKEGPAFYAALEVETDMPAFGTVLSDEDIAAVLAYIKSTWPPQVRAQQSQAGH